MRLTNSDDIKQYRLQKAPDGRVVWRFSLSLCPSCALKICVLSLRHIYLRRYTGHSPHRHIVHEDIPVNTLTCARRLRRCCFCIYDRRIYIFRFFLSYDLLQKCGRTVWGKTALQNSVAEKS